MCSNLGHPDYCIIEPVGQLFLKEVSQSRIKISKLCMPFISDGAVRISFVRFDNFPFYLSVI